jgi:hypothetical protein
MPNLGNGMLALIIILTVALAIAWGYFDTAVVVNNETTSITVDTKTRLEALYQVACKHTAVCSYLIQVTGRSMKSKGSIPKGSALLEIPRSMQISDLDALRDPFVRKHLLQARHKRSNNTISSRAHLAAYLTLLQKRRDPAGAAKEGSIVVQQTYLDYLPTFEEYASFHPVLQDPEDLALLLGKHSYTLKLVERRREEFESEYDGFSAVSPEFASLVSQQDYFVARIHVASRCFGAEGQVDDLLKEEKQLYEQKLGYGKVGIVAMAPVLDSLNHHVQPNVDWVFDKKSLSFILYANTEISGGWDLMGSYGPHPDPWLYAMYGFNNGDGSSPTSRSIASFHDMYNPEVHIPVVVSGGGASTLSRVENFQREQLLQYLAYDDGYNNCIEGPEENLEAAELKRLKLALLQQIANDPDSWTVTISPRNPNARPRKASSTTPGSPEPPAFDPAQEVPYNDSFMRILTTCRLLALTHRDYEGDAIPRLRKSVRQFQFGNAAGLTSDKGRQFQFGKAVSLTLEKGNDALELRSLMWMYRLADIEFKKYGTTSVEQEMETVARLNLEAFQSPEWSAAHVRLGELQSLILLLQFAEQMSRQYSPGAGMQSLSPSASEDWILRDKPCPIKNLDFLLE